MGYKEDAALVTKHIETMEKAGGELLDKTGAYNPLLAVFQDGADAWVPDNGNQAAKTYVTYEGVFYYVNGMMVVKDMLVKDPNGKTYLCTLPSGEYKLVNPPSEAASIFTEKK